MPSLSQSSGKKQQSISSFFTKQPPNPSSSPAATSTKALASPASKEDLFLSDEDEPPRNIQTIRRAKRTSNDAQLNTTLCVDSHTQHDSKRRRKSTEASIDEDSDSHHIESPLHPINANGGKKPRISDRTSRFLFSDSPSLDGDDRGENELSLKERELLHQRFVKKLGRPDSIAEIKRRHHFSTEPTEEAQENDDDAGSEPDELPNKKKGAATKKSGSKLTPLEKQVLEIKSKYADTILVVEVGYKFRFFGEDARIAAKELHIVCIPGKLRYDEHFSEAHLDRFASASIPVHRLHVHVKRLVSAGHKVGVVRQLETAALKAAGDNRNAPFVRKLTNLYTKGTYVDDVEGLNGPDDEASRKAPATGYLLCLTETKAKGWGTDEKVQVGIVAVQPATGDIIYDNFEDGFMRSEIETRLLHIAPCEFLIVGELSKASEKLVKHLSASKTNVFGDKARVERVERPKTMAALAYSHVSNFYAGKLKEVEKDQDQKAQLLDKVLNLAEEVTICLSAMITHLSDYGLEHVFDLTKYFQSFSARSHMLLNGTTLSSLEVYQNQTDHLEKGSLFWTLNRTKTRFGKRLLRKWVGRPLLDRIKLEERVAAVEEIKENKNAILVEKIRQLLGKINVDLEKSLLRIYYAKCTRPELLSVLQTLQRIANEFASFKDVKDVGFESTLLNEAVASLPTISDGVIAILEKINPQAAKDDDKYAFFREAEETDEISEHKLGIASVEQELDAHRPVAAAKVKKSKVTYVTVAGIEYLIEIENGQLKSVPASWQKISGTKKVSRFHTPEVVRLIRERDQHKEALAAACDSAFKDLLRSISAQYQLFRDCIQSLALLDCLYSLAAIASQPGYVKPTFTDETCIAIEQGRHPMVEQLLLDAYVPNDTDLATDRTRALLITGPNMGGKSSYVRHVALLAIMGQIGSYVPAKSARLGILDAVFTRMGAADNMMAGESTFMVELSETADVLKQATPRSLVILDELGRGTSTHDGVAIAQAVLDHVVRETRCLTLFITHYQHLAAMARGFEADKALCNVHMRFTEGGEGGRDITFLYEVGEGIAHRSYGLNVARLANVPPSILGVAEVKSNEMETKAREKRLAALPRAFAETFQSHEREALDLLVARLEEL